MNGIPINTENSPSIILELIFRLKVKDVMSTNLISAEKTEPMREVQRLMRHKGISGVPIVEGKRILGLVSMYDILEAWVGDHIHETCEKYMSKDLKVLEDDMPLSFAISYFDRFTFGRFPVLNKKRELVGIVTSRDIVSKLLLEVNKEVEKLEATNTQQLDIHTGNITMEFPVRKHDFENAGKASTEIKKLVREKGFPTKLARRVAVACYELEMNIVVHSDGGNIRFELSDTEAIITAQDKGPGIPDVNRALEVGYSTANEWIRSLGFGAGMGLPNIRRVSDDFSIESSVGEEPGTKVCSTILIPGHEAEPK
jgi:CBS domain-containing protein/anti-sigma regulatory factor (Ser/Thr protein kinase)